VQGQRQQRLSCSLLGVLVHCGGGVAAARAWPLQPVRHAVSGSTVASALWGGGGACACTGLLWWALGAVRRPVWAARAPCGIITWCVQSVYRTQACEGEGVECKE
jgi:hypothetical protein